MPKATHSVLVLFRKGMFEAYIDGLLVQSFVCADPATRLSFAFQTMI